VSLVVLPLILHPLFHGFSHKVKGHAATPYTSLTFFLALSPKETPFSLQCFHVVCHLSHQNEIITATLVVSAIVRLGGNPAAFESLDSRIQGGFVGKERRVELVSRLIAILTMLSK
jgi:hypothetical protein